MIRVYLSRMYEWDSAGKVRSDVIRDGFFECPGFVVVMKDRNSCCTGRRFKYGQF